MIDSHVPQQDDITIQIHQQDNILFQHKQDDAMLNPQLPRQQNNIILPPEFLEQEYHQENYEQYNNGIYIPPSQTSDIKLIFRLTYSFLQLDIEYTTQYEKSEELRKKLIYRQNVQNVEAGVSCCLCILQMIEIASTKK